MAYFIVIGTGNDVKHVVDGIKDSHLQHNVITSGCVICKEEGLFYDWNVFNEKGEDKTQKDNGPIDLHDALTNQISQFKTLIPEGAIPNVFIISTCFDEDESDNLQMVYKELNEIGGTVQLGLLIDIVLLGYNLQKSSDVTLRPHWNILKSIRGLGNQGQFNTNILYINNMDYSGAATNVDARILCKFLCNWSKMVCSNSNPRTFVQNRVYSIGMSEHQYDFRDLNEFFSLAAEERLLERTLNNAPSSDTQALLDTNYYKKINLDHRWIDGLCKIQSDWESYSSTEWDPSVPLASNAYSLSRQEQELASYLNSYLQLYIAQEQREIDRLNGKICEKEAEIAKLSDLANTEKEILEGENLEDNSTTEERTEKLKNEISNLQTQIRRHEANIARNTFLDANGFNAQFGHSVLLTDEDEEQYNEHSEKVLGLIDYVKSVEGINTMREAVNRATGEDSLPQSYPDAAVQNMGFVVPRTNAISTTSDTTTPPESSSDSSATEEQKQRTGCLGAFLGIFKRKSEATIEQDDNQEPTPTLPSSAPIDSTTALNLIQTLNNCVNALRKADDVRHWWSNLCDTVEKDQKRQEECLLKMNGEKDLNGRYLPGKEGYHPPRHRKSTSLIDMDKVRAYRDTDPYYHQNLDKFLCRWFDAEDKPGNRMSMRELIKHQVLDPLVGRWHTLKWDGTNPFVNENITDEQMHAYIEHDTQQSKPFVEYVRLQNDNLTTALNVQFFSNNPNIPGNGPEFRQKYTLGTQSIGPVHLDDFVNSLCVVQVMDIRNHIDSIKDFKPKREAELHPLHADITETTLAAVGLATTIEAKARAIYDWICANIAYDTTKQIHDANTCWNTKRGVCQAYCELFCYMAEKVGLTAEMVNGKTKKHNGEIPEEGHAWILVYKQGYDAILIDPTWGAGSVNGNKFIRNTDNSMWFDVSPYWMIFSHFPEKEEWTMLGDYKISEDQFKKLPFEQPHTDTDGKDYLFEKLTPEN